jgi:hypothetical protein
MTNQSAHSLQRTSPKGEDFVGRCVQCGKPDLRSPFEGECPNPEGVTQDEALLRAIGADDGDDAA